MWRGKAGFLAGLALFVLGTVMLGSPVAAQLVTSESVAGVDNIAPAPVAGVTARASLSGPGVDVGWELSSDDYQGWRAASGDFTSGGVFVRSNDVAKYRIWRQDGDGAMAVIANVAAGVSEYRDATAVTGVVYTYAVNAVDAAGNESAAVAAAPISLGPPPNSETNLPPIIRRFRVTFFGAMPADLEQFRIDFAIVIARILGLQPGQIRIVSVRAGSVIVEFDIDDPNADAEGDQLIAALEANPNIVRNMANALGLPTDFEPVTEVGDFRGTDLDFGTVLAGMTATRTVEITNTSLDPAAVLGVSAEISGAGYTVTPASAALAQYESVTLTLVFAADAVGGVAGTYPGQLIVRTNDPDALETVVALTAAVSEALLLPEDFNRDGVVGLDDFFLFADEFGRNSTMPEFKPGYDLDLSGAIDLGDFFKFADKFGYRVVGGEIVAP